MTQIARNKKTGEFVAKREGSDEWLPVKVAINPTGRTAISFDGEGWEEAKIPPQHLTGPDAPEGPREAMQEAVPVQAATNKYHDTGGFGAEGEAFVPQAQKAHQGRQSPPRLGVPEAAGSLPRVGGPSVPNGTLSPQVPAAGAGQPQPLETPVMPDAPAAPGLPTSGGRNNPRVRMDTATPAAPADGQTVMGDLTAGVKGLQQALQGVKAGYGARQITTGLQEPQNIAEGVNAAQNELTAINARIAQIEAEARATDDTATRNALGRERSDLMRQREELQFRLDAADPMRQAAQDRVQSGIGNVMEAGPRIAQLGEEIAAIPGNEAADKLAQAETFKEGWQAFKTDPMGAMQSLTLRSLPNSAPSIGGAIIGTAVAGPVGAAVGAGGAGFATEFGATVAQEFDATLKRNGIDPTDRNQVMTYISQNPQEFGDMMAKGMIRAGVIGAADAVSGGLSGALAKWAVNAGRGARVGAAGAGGIVEALGEGAGEAGAQLATEGKIAPGEVMAEALGGAGQGSVTTGGQMIAEALKKGPTPETQENKAVEHQKPAENTEKGTASPEQPKTPAAPEAAPEAPAPTETPATQEAPAQPEAPAVEEGPQDALPGEELLEDENGAPVYVSRDAEGKLYARDPGQAPTNPELAQTQPETPEAQPEAADPQPEAPVMTPQDVAQRIEDAGLSGMSTDEAVAKLAESGAIRPKDLPRRPFTQMFRDKGMKIDPEGAFGKELKARGIAPGAKGTPPGMFKKGGAHDFDNIPISEMRENYPSAPDDGNGYVDREWLLQQIEAEHRGEPLYTEGQRVQADEIAGYDAALEALEQGKPFDLGELALDNAMTPQTDAWDTVIPGPDEDISTDRQRSDFVASTVKAALGEAGFPNLWRHPVVQHGVEKLVKEGGDVYDAVGYAVDALGNKDAANRGADIPFNEGDFEGNGNARTEEDPTDGAPAEVQRPDAPAAQPASQPGDAAGTPEGNRGRSETVDADAAPSADATAGATERTDAGEQSLIPGVAPVTDKDRAETQAKKPMQGGNAAMQDDGLFGDPGNRGDLFDAPAAPKAEPKADAAPKRPEGYGANNKLVSTERADELRKELIALLKNRANSGIDPQLLTVGAQLAVYHLEAGVRKFADFAKTMADDLQTTQQDLRPYLRAWYTGAQAMMEDSDLDTEGMDDAATVRQYVQSLRDGKEPANDVARGSDEPNGNLLPDNGVGQGDVPAGSGGTGSGGNGDVRSAGGQGARPAGDERLSDGGTDPDGAAGGSVGTGGSTRSDGGSAGDGQPGGRGAADGARQDAGESRGGRTEDDAADARAAADERDGTERSVTDAETRSKEERVEAQRKANREAFKEDQKVADLDQIKAQLPMLLPGQQEDVLKAEQRFFKPAEGKKQGYGMLFTNGTGTGKTFSAAGIIKRFHAAGKENILILTKSNSMSEFEFALGMLDVPVSTLKDISSAGTGVVMTTINGGLGKNKALAERDWDLIISDETNYVSENKDGQMAQRGFDFRGITNHPQHLMRKADMLTHEEKLEIEAIEKEINALKGMDDDRVLLEIDKLQDKRDDLNRKRREKMEKIVQHEATKPRPQVAMLSATPFTSVLGVDYAEGYLFDYDHDKKGSGYNEPDGRQAFFIKHFGYRMKENRLTQPDVGVDTALMEREFNQWLIDQGALSSRVLDVEADYERHFIKIKAGVGGKIDEAFKWLQENKEFHALKAAYEKNFTYHMKVQLLEAIKAEEAIPLIKADMALGRKVVVFHDRQAGGGFNPFDINLGEFAENAAELNQLAALQDAFLEALPWVKDLDFSGLEPARQRLLREFPEALIVGSGVSPKKAKENKALFNVDGTPSIVITQSESGKDGWSGHDTTGQHQRAIHNLGIPVKATQMTQQEGRIYRTGQVSDAIFRYYDTGTAFEKRFYASVIAERVDTAENLAMGTLARGLKESVVDAFMNSTALTPRPGEGKGGKERDRSFAGSTSPFEKAKTYYWAQQKDNRNRANRRGKEYYATPEPVGFKMVEWAGLRANERVLEPSAGHGAIARFFPENTQRTVIEPSYELNAELAMVTAGATNKSDTFEDLDKRVKFDAIVMNPPYGKGGKTAMEHLRKAATHLRNGGRIVALLPRGPMADKYLNAAIDSDDMAGVYPIMTVQLPSVTFKRAGTGVQTAIVVFEKQTDSTVATELMSRRPDHHTIEADSPEALFDAIKDMEAPERLNPITQAEANFDPIPEGPASATPSGALVESTTRSQRRSGKGDLYQIVKTPRTDTETYYALKDAAKRHDGFYARVWKGFAFKDEAKATAFQNEVTNGKERRGFTSEFRQAAPTFMQALRDRLDALGLDDVKLGELTGADRDVSGRFSVRDGNAEILIRTGLGSMDALNHEAIHALKSAGVFTDAEWKALTAMADSKWLDRYGIAEKYPELDKAGQQEEAIAEAFAEWAFRNGGTGNTGWRGAFTKIARFFKAIGEALGIVQISDAEQIFRNVDKGKIGKREKSDYDRTVAALRKTVGAHKDDSFTTYLTYRSLFNWYKPAAPGMMTWAGRNVRRLFQDAFLPVRQMQAHVTGGKDVAALMDPDLQETLWDSKAGAMLDKLQAEFTAPIAKIMGENKISTRAVGFFLITRHARERNRVIQERTGKGNGSGMRQVDIIFRETELRQEMSAEQMAALAEIGKLVDKMHRAMITYRLNAGLITQEEADNWRETYKHYVPLKGYDEIVHDERHRFARDMGEEGSIGRSRTGQGFNVRGPEAMRATGRDGVGMASADDLLAHVFSQANEAIIRGHKNDVTQAMLKLAESYPSDHWEIVKKKPKRVFNRESGVISYISVYADADRNADNVMSAKVDGKEVLLRFNNPELARAMRNFGKVEVNMVLRWASTATRFVGQTMTKFNPAFWPVAMLRDVGGATMIAAKYSKEVPGIRRKLLGNMPGAMKAAWQMFGQFEANPDSEWSKVAQEFRRAGGETSFIKYADLSGRKKAVEKLASRHDTGAVAWSKRRWDGFFGFVDQINNVTDNATRLALYRALRENGYSPAKAAREAKEITVNFNRRGELTRYLSAGFMFLNPAIQGMHTIMKNWKHLMGAGAALATLGVLQEVLVGMMDPEDWEEIPEYQKQRNMIFVIPGQKKRIMIPIQYGFSTPFNAGRNLAAVASGRTSIGDGIASVLKEFTQSWSPVGEPSLMIGLPDIVEPVVEVAMNRNTFFGSQIHYGDKKKGPLSDQDASSVKDWAATIAQGVDDLPLIGVDLHPKAVEYLAFSYTGGAGRFVQGGRGLVDKLLAGEEIKPSDIVALNRLYSETSVSNKMGLAYGIKSTAEAASEKFYRDLYDFSMKRAAQENARMSAQDWVQFAAKNMPKALRDYRTENKALLQITGFYDGKMAQKAIEKGYQQYAKNVKAKNALIAEGFDPSEMRDWNTRGDGAYLDMYRAIGDETPAGIFNARLAKLSKDTKAARKNLTGADLTKRMAQIEELRKRTADDFNAAVRKLRP